MRVHAYLTEREATLYLDTSGEALFKRGWRRDADVAPLRENLAAGVLALAGWTPGTPLLDPMCGAGTIAIEAALAAADIAPGLSARSASRSSRGTTARRGSASASARATACARRRRRRRSSRATSTRARSRNAGATPPPRASRRGSTSSEADVLARPAPAPSGLLVANPPYGVRLDDDAALAAFYPKLGDALKQHFAGWTACLLTGDPRLAEADRPQAIEAHAALQRRDRMPAVPLRDRERAAAARAARTAAAGPRMIRSGFRPPSPPRAAAAMPMLPARHYESEHTRFIREMKDRKPELEREQRQSRAIWWDKRPAGSRQHERRWTKAASRRRATSTRARTSGRAPGEPTRARLRATVGMR